jgi:hypothetical protein
MDICASMEEEGRRARLHPIMEARGPSAGVWSPFPTNAYFIAWLWPDFPGFGVAARGLTADVNSRKWDSAEKMFRG